MTVGKLLVTVAWIIHLVSVFMKNAFKQVDLVFASSAPHHLERFVGAVRFVVQESFFLVKCKPSEFSFLLIILEY